MASTSQPFPSRPYTSGLLSTAKLPDRSTPAGFGASSHTHSAREAARLERDRQERERQAREQDEAGGSGAMAQLTDEQKDEINEAVSVPDITLKVSIEDSAILN
jgi:centrin-3